MTETKTDKIILIIAIILGFILLIADAKAGQAECDKMDMVYDQSTGKCINQ